jgi:hypothetical protein
MKKKSSQIILIFLIFNSFISNAQIKKENFKLGFNYGTGTENAFPFNSKDYDHTVSQYKIQINYVIKEKGKWSYEINIEPSYNIAKHQLLNKFFIKPSSGDDFLERRDLFTQNREIKEYVLNFGFLTRYAIVKKLSVYNLASVGPMLSDKATERLAKGFAFSDILAFGTSYEIGEIVLDVRYSLRHTSNANFKKPNQGHNTMNIEFGMLFEL